MPTLLRRLSLALACLVLLAAAVVGGAVALLAWRPDLLKGQVERLASAAAGAPVRIAGPLGVELGRVTTVTAEGIAVDAPDWAASPTLAEVRRLLVSVDLGAYLRSRALVIPELRLEGPSVALERDARGRTSWPAPAGDGAEVADATDDSAEAAPPALPRIGDLAIEGGRLAYRDAAAGVALDGTVDTVRPDPAAGAGAADAAASGRDFSGLRLDGTGTVRGDPLAFGLEVGSPLILARPGEPFPIRGRLDLAGSRLELDGAAADPLALRGLTLALRLASDDPTKLLALAGRAVEGAPRDLAVEARLTRGEAAFELASLRARWGESRLEGALAYDPTPERPLLTGDLRSPLLDLAALRPVIAGGGSEPTPPEGQGIAVPIDARVGLAADLVRLPGDGVPELRGVAAGVRLEEGRLTLDPLRLGVGDGTLRGRVETADLADEPLEAALRLEAEALDLAPLRPFLPEGAGRGDLAGRLTGTLEGTLRGTTADIVLGRSELALDAALDGLRLAGLAPREARLAVKLADGALRLDPLRLALPGDGGALAGSVAVAGLAPRTAEVRTSEQGGGGDAGDRVQPLRIDLDLDAEGLDLAPLVALAPAAAAEAAAGLAGRFTGTLEGALRGAGAAAILAGSDVSLAGAFAGLRYAGLAADRAELTARLADGGLRLDPLRLALAGDGGTLEGSVALAGLAGGGEPPAVALDLDAKGLALAPLLALAPAAREAAGDLAGGFTGTLEGTLRGADAAAVLAGSDLTLAGAFAGLRRGDLAANEAELTARLADGGLSLDPLRLALPQGRLAGKVAVANLAGLAAGDGQGRGEPLAAEVDLAGEGVDLAALLGPGSGVGGLLRGRLGGVVRGATPAEILARSELAFAGRVERPTAPRIGDRLGEALDLEASLRPPGKAGEAGALRAVATGTAGGQPLRLELTGDDLGNLLAGEGAFPAALQATLGETRAAARGTLALPFATGDIDAALSLEGPGPGPVLALLELPAIELPPYGIAGNLTRRGETYRAQGLEGRVGDSDVAGALEVRLDGPRPKVTGELRSRLLDIDDLGGLVGAEPATGPGETGSAGQRAEAAAEQRDGQVLPDDPIQTSRWRSLDLDVALVATEVRAGRIPLDGFEARAVLDAGRLRVDPLDLRLGEGVAAGWVELDARGRGEPRASLELDLARLPLGRLLSRLEVDTASLGTLSGRARGGAALGGQGFSVAQILGASDGEMTLLVEGGTLNRRLVTALGFDLLRVFATILGTAPEEVRLACAIADLAVKDGVVTTRSLAIDTAVADIGGEGTIDLGSEAIDLALVADPKGVAGFGGRTGVRVAGTLAEPRIELNPARLLARGAAAATLGVFLSPLTRLADSLGVDEQRRRAGSPCAALLDEVPGGGEGGERPSQNP